MTSNHPTSFLPRGNKELFEKTWISDKWNFEDKYPVIKISLTGIGLDNYNLGEALNIIDDIAKKK